jgi:hypothetical protein
MTKPTLTTQKFSATDASPLDRKAARVSENPERCAAMYAARDYLLSRGCYSENGGWVSPDGRRFRLVAVADEVEVVEDTYGNNPF